MFWAARALHWEHQHASKPAPEGVGNPLKRFRDWDSELQLFRLNEEFLVSASHQLALIASLPFVHTARRYYRVDVSLRSSDDARNDRKVVPVALKVLQGGISRGSKSRNKVSVGEPAEGSLPICSFRKVVADCRHESGWQLDTSVVAGPLWGERFCARPRLVNANLLDCPGAIWMSAW